MGSSESQPKSKQKNDAARTPEQSRPRARTVGSEQSPNNVNNNSHNNAAQQQARRPTKEELLEKVRDGIATTHGMLSTVPDGAEGTALKLELERRLMLLLSYEERLLSAQNGGQWKPEVDKKPRLHPVIAQCPRITYTAEHAKTDEEEKITCSICWVDYEVGQLVMILPCLHWVHASCGEEWLARKPQCPLCQIDVVQTMRSCQNYTD
eukprot:GILI01007523.1.p1 GENE.GILI01007523.1~~GILI01007523.1.p1  ORF type:complete len:208 (-),score=15.50 GILI01007523.1:165-788(-)